MSVRQYTLREYSTRASSRRSHDAVEEARRIGKQTAFLSHSHKDATLAKGVQEFLRAQGWDVYIDWQDYTMPSTPDRRTAERIQERIRVLNWFLFLATANSMQSRWCPWEIGYADGVKPYDSILIIPTSDSDGRHHGNEYLQLYRRITTSDKGEYGAFGPNNRGRLLRGMPRVS